MSGGSSKDKVTEPAFNGRTIAVFSVLAVAFIYFILPFVAAPIIYIYPWIQGWTSSRTEAWLTSSVVAQFCFIFLVEALTLLVIFGLLRRFRWTFATIGLTKPRWFHPLVGVAAAVPYFFLYIVLTQIVALLVPAFNEGQEQQIGFNSVQGPLQLTLTFISLVVLPPLVEEIVMRGFLYSGLRKWLPRIAAALAVSLLFGAAHLAQGGAAGPLWVGALDTFVLSMVLIWLRERTGNLWAGITLHAVKNGIAFVALFILSVR